MATCLHWIARVIIATAVAFTLWLPVATAGGPQGSSTSFEVLVDLGHQDETSQGETASRTQFPDSHIHHTSDHTHETPGLVELFVSSPGAERTAGPWEDPLQFDGSNGVRLERPPRI